jgi:hypothetical protein
MRIPGLVFLTAALLTGCTSARNAHIAQKGAPGLEEDSPLSHRGGVNPNAPYTTVDHSVHLVKRPSVVDVEAAVPCTASDLSLFESGASVDGEIRSVRLSLVNHTQRPCRLSGYPTVSLLRSDQSVIGSIVIQKVTATTIEAALHTSLPSGAAEPKLPPHNVLLAPSGEATFEVGWTSRPTCEQVASIAVAAPGTIQSFPVHHSLTVCEGRILLTAVTGGSHV